MRRGALTPRDQQMRLDRGGPHPQMAGSGFLVQAVPGQHGNGLCELSSDPVGRCLLVVLKTARCEADKMGHH